MDATLKKKILISIAVVIGVFLLAALGVFIFFNAQFSVYQDDQYKFSIKYPSSWRMVLHPQKNVSVVFLRPKDTVLDSIQENFNITIQPVPDDIFNLAGFSARIKTQLTAVFGKTIDIVEDKPLQWGWREGHEIVIKSLNSDHLIMVNAWILSNNQAYILTYLGDMNKYPKDSFYINEMIRSLQLQ